MNYDRLSRRWLGKVGLTIAALAACFAASCTMAPAHAETRIGLHLGSYHASGDYNNFNPGVYVYHNGWTAGTYYNSERHQSVYAGYTFEHPLVGPFSGGLTVGAITGYQRAAILPLVVPSVSLRVSPSVSARLSVIPPVSGMPLVLHASIEWRFK